MVHGIFFHLQFPFAHFATRGIAGESLYPLVWEAVRRLEALGLKVISATSDGASPNRKFFRMHYDKKDPSTFIHKAVNPFAEDQRWLYFFSDPPHLVKTIRNCWYQSGINGTRHMQVLLIVIVHQ